MQSRREDSRSFWRRLRRDYGPRFNGNHNNSNNNNEKRNQQNLSPSRRDGAGVHLTVDQLAARRKFEQLQLLTTTDLAIVNSAEPYRVSNFDLFKRNLLDPTLYATICLVYTICRLINASSSSGLISSIITFAVIFLALDYHIESYRSFSSVRQSVELLSGDYKLRKAFLSTHLGYNPGRRVRVPISSDQCSSTGATGGADNSSELQVEVAEAIDEIRSDTFHWINRIIEFFWPYLSHLVHYELNEFFRDQIESGSLGRSDEGLKRLLYALVRQLNTNILVIERCQLGYQAPFIRNVSVFEGTTEEQQKHQPTNNTNSNSKPNIDAGATKNDGKTLVYNINLEYSGDMNIAVIYRYLCCCTSRVGLKDMFLNFNMRFIWGPIKSEMPFIDQLSFTLLELPEFGYKGIALVELAELKIVRRVINRLITEHLLYPRVVSMSLKQLMEALINGPRSKTKASSSREIDIRKPDDISYRTKMTANLLLFGCMCSNAFLRCCQKTSQN